MAEKDIQLKQVLKRFPPGDRWTPADKDEPVFSNLTEGIEWVFQSTNEHLPNKYFLTDWASE